MRSSAAFTEKTSTDMLEYTGAFGALHIAARKLNGYVTAPH